MRLAVGCEPCWRQSRSGSGRPIRLAFCSWRRAGIGGTDRTTCVERGNPTRSRSGRARKGSHPFQFRWDDTKVQQALSRGCRGARLDGNEGMATIKKVAKDGLMKENELNLATQIKRNLAARFLALPRLLDTPRSEREELCPAPSGHPSIAAGSPQKKNRTD